MNIAIIDDKINLLTVKHIFGNTDNIHVINDYAISDAEMSHGTLCVWLYLEYRRVLKIYDNDSIFFLSVCDYQGRKSIDSLKKALLWCLKADIRIINLSVGFSDNTYSNELYDIISRLYMKGTIMIASCSNDNRITFPASFDNVIGVRSNVKKEKPFIFSPSDMTGVDIQLNAPYIEYISQKIQSNNYNLLSNSFIVPYVSVLVAEILIDSEQFFDITKVKVMLSNQYSIEIATKSNYRSLMGKIYRMKYSLDEIQIPVLAYFYSTNDEKRICDSLQDILIDNDYNCALITDYQQNNDWRRNRYRVNENISTDILIYCNIINASIIILCINDKYIEKLNKGLSFDGIILSKNRRIHTKSPFIYIDSRKKGIEKKILRWVLELFQ